MDTRNAQMTDEDHGAADQGDDGVLVREGRHLLDVGYRLLEKGGTFSTSATACSVR